MKTIADAVGDYVKSHPFLQSSINQGLINLTTLARFITPELEDALQKPVKQGAVVMALKRISCDMEFRITHKVAHLLRKIEEITVRSDLTDYAFAVSDSILQAQALLIDEIKAIRGVFYTSSRGVDETNIIISNKTNLLVEKLFVREKCLQKTENLASITVKLPEENTRVPGVYYVIFHRLAWENVVVNEVISTSNEFTIIVGEDQLETAFRVIKTLRA